MGTARQGTLRLVIHSQNLEMGLRLYIIFAIAIGVVAAQRKRYSDYDVNYRPRYNPDSRDYDDDELDEELNFIGGKVQTIEQKLEREIREHPPNRRRRAKYRDFFKHVMNIFEKGVKFVPMILRYLTNSAKMVQKMMLLLVQMNLLNPLNPLNPLNTIQMLMKLLLQMNL